ncbi:MAG TPA: HAMP domain-containing sensor histidine kinase [Gaiellaceae bacterium]|nr:HAMP domain-containing sensor histidine kinase [Gaiellaceae bacterium]
MPRTTGLLPHVPQECDESFAAYVAHELRTPLATQRALLEVTLGDPAAGAVAWRAVAENVLEACKHQEQLLEACLTLARSRNGLRRPETVDLGSIAATLVPAHDLRGLKLRSGLASARASGDPVLIERLLDNLLANAVRHNRPDGFVEITTRRSGTKALLAVANSGPRIRADELARLLEPFQQHGGPDRRPGGLGLGLSVAKAVATAHNATLTALARRTGGLRIEVAFPAATG